MLVIEPVFVSTELQTCEYGDILCDPAVGQRPGIGIRHVPLIQSRLFFLERVLGFPVRRSEVSAKTGRLVCTVEYDVDVVWKEPRYPCYDRLLSGPAHFRRAMTYEIGSLASTWRMPFSAIAAVLDLPSFASVRRDCNKKGDLVELIYQ